jgi:hypothetical protein
MIGTEETKLQIVTRLWDQVQKMNCEGGEFSKLAAQRITHMEDAFKDIKQDIRRGFDGMGDRMIDLDEKLNLALVATEKRTTEKIDLIIKIVIGCLAFTIILAILAGVNIAEIVKNWKGTAIF